MLKESLQINIVFSLSYNPKMNPIEAGLRILRRNKLVTIGGAAAGLLLAHHFAVTQVNEARRLQVVADSNQYLELYPFCFEPSADERIESVPGKFVGQAAYNGMRLTVVLDKDGLQQRLDSERLGLRIRGIQFPAEKGETPGSYRLGARVVANTPREETLAEGTTEVNCPPTPIDQLSDSNIRRGAVFS
jgi:hypothetical protein